MDIGHVVDQLNQLNQLGAPACFNDSHGGHQNENRSAMTRDKGPSKGSYLTIYLTLSVSSTIIYMFNNPQIVTILAIICISITPA